MSLYRYLLCAVFAAGFLLPASRPASALLVQPVLINLSTTGANSTAGITIGNDRNRPNTVEVSVQSLAIPENGPPVLSPNDGDEFLIFPPTATIAPGGMQVVRVRWVGDAALKQAKTYMFTVRELPVDRPAGSGVQLVYSIQEIVTVSSPGLKAAVSIAQIRRSTRTVPVDQGKSTKTENGIEVTFKNAGNDVALLSQSHISFSDGSWSASLDPGQVNQAIGIGLVPPASSRVLFFPMDGVPPSGDITASVNPGDSF